MKWRGGFIDTRPLRGSRPFRDLWIGSLASQLGGQIATVAVLAQVWELTGSPVGTGAIGLVTGVATLLFGLLGGTLADAVDRRTVVRLSTGGQLLAAAGLCAQALAGNRNVVVLLALVATGAACGALGAPARRTFPVRLLPADQVAAGLALSNISFQAAMLAGPALAGLVIARWDFPAAYAAQAVAVAISMLSVIRLPSMRPEHTGTPDGKRRAQRGGWRIVLQRPTLWGVMATDLSATLLAMPIALFPLVNEARFGGDPRTLGFFLSAVAVGGITAGLLSGTVTRRRRAGLVQLTAQIVANSVGTAFRSRAQTGYSSMPATLPSSAPFPSPSETQRNQNSQPATYRASMSVRRSQPRSNAPSSASAPAPNSSVPSPCWFTRATRSATAVTRRSRLVTLTLTPSHRSSSASASQRSPIGAHLTP
ncbi:MFS transporter [Streptomyces niveus]|uniref:MFS transporter n=1 Tax=Streptomyces niveus TaxID=193462 RepID=UPI00344A25FF